MSVFAVAVLAVGGCVSLDEWRSGPERLPGPEMEPAALPSYAVGDSFRYDNGTTYTVERISGETGLIKWKRGKSRTIYSPPNFIIPDLKWSSRKMRGRFESDVALDAMWPLAPDAETYFIGKRESRPKNGGAAKISIRAYDCQVDGTETLELTIGVFDTYKVVCRRLTRGRTLSRVYHWYYAPAVGHYVRKDTFDRYGGLKSSIKLASVLRADRGLSETALATRNLMLTEALETWPSGTTRDWRDPAGQIGVAVTVAGTFKTENGAFCRRYLQEITLGSRTRVDPGIACRTEGGWRRI